MARDNRIPVMMSDDELGAIDKWRFDNKIGSRSKAIRLLCQQAVMGCKPRIRVRALSCNSADAEFQTTAGLAL